MLHIRSLHELVQQCGDVVGSVRPLGRGGLSAGAPDHALWTLRARIPAYSKGPDYPWLTSGLLGTSATDSWGSGTLPYTYAFTGEP